MVEYLCGGRVAGDREVLKYEVGEEVIVSEL